MFFTNPQQFLAHYSKQHHEHGLDFFFFCSNIYLTPSDLKVKFLDESRGDLNASIFSWSLVNVISSEPGLIFY